MSRIEPKFIRDLDLEALRDVDLTSPVDGQILRYNGDLSQWVNFTPVDGLTNVAAVSSNYSVGATDKAVEVTTGTSTIQITLPTPSGNQGRECIVSKIDSASGVVDVLPLSGTISGQSSIRVDSQWGAARFLCNGSAWRLIV